MFERKNEDAKHKEKLNKIASFKHLRVLGMYTIYN